MSPKERVKCTTHYKAFLGLDQESGWGGGGPGAEDHSIGGDRSWRRALREETGARDTSPFSLVFPSAHGWSSKEGTQFPVPHVFFQDKKKGIQGRG